MLKMGLNIPKDYVQSPSPMTIKCLIKLIKRTYIHM